MKKLKVYATIIGFLFIGYVVALGYISARMNSHPYRITTSATQIMYEVTRDKDAQVIYVPIKITNNSNRLISSNNKMNMGYHLYKIDSNGKQEMISWDNPLTSIKDIFNNESGICNVAISIPDKAGTYICYIDLLEDNKCWFSEKGVLTIPVTVEVK